MHRPRTLLGEAALIAVTVLALAIVVNAALGKGISLTKNYFPATQAQATPEGHAGDSQASEQGTSSSSGKLQHEFESSDLATTQAWQPYAGQADSGVVILDARSEKLFLTGRIPGSTLCYHYQSDRYIPDLLPTLKAADVIIIYCAGGDCEDSIQLATDLVYAHGVSKQAISIFEGGWEEWIEAGLEVQKD